MTGRSTPYRTSLGARSQRRAQAAAPFRWKVTTVHGRRDGSTPGSIISTKPAAGDKLKRGGTLVLVISDGNTLSTIPTNLAGQQASNAEATLRKLGLVPKTTHRFDEQVAKDHVIGLAAGTPAKLPKREAVGLVVSDGPKPRIVPRGLNGITPTAAKKQLAAVQLKAKQSPQYNETVPKGRIISTKPDGGANAARDSTVTLAVSRGPKPRVVPGLVGDVGGHRTSHAVGHATRGHDDQQVQRHGAGRAGHLDPADTWNEPRPRFDGGAGRLEGTRPRPRAEHERRLVDRRSHHRVATRGSHRRQRQRTGRRRPVSTTPSAGQQVKRGSSVDIVLG